MQFTPTETSSSRFSLRPFLAGGIAVLLAVASLAFLTEAFAGDGQTVYLANIEPGGKEFPTQPSIVVTGSGGATAPAEEATLQLLIVRAAPYSREFGMGAPVSENGQELGGPSLAPVIDAVRGAGVAADAIQIVSSPSLISVCPNSAKCSAVRLDISLDQPDLAGLNAIVNAAGEAAGAQELTVQDVGAGYTVADCRPMHAEARAAAAADARARAEAQAVVLGVTLGTLVVSSETAPTAPHDANGCAPFEAGATDAWWTPGSVGLTVPSFDPQAAPAVVAAIQITLAFAIGSEAAGAA